MGLYRQELRDEEENRVLEVKDVFYNTEHHRYSARYQYVDEMIAGETALEDMDWVHVYDLFEFATPIKTVDQSDAQLSEFEQHRLENIARNEKFLASLGFKDAGKKAPKKKKAKTVAKATNMAVKRSRRLQKKGGRNPKRAAKWSEIRIFGKFKRPSKALRNTCSGTPRPSNMSSKVSGWPL